ncbi:MarR family transcriptional regulator [Acidiferrimicrobium sp. IK]|uniref:MarR family winged helix-turn-helix transcriptional regulator n=1 Tax=Acidiferrimicrobium sp. IK TaxID=2871700 RepID=UPI0021CB5308|nr:MarR family transcriptional regulator [Acidiferrimicrobium sp. IK]MCU4186741.1 MarR family transcriptional regulator [Acidiferrimicrobium sp. IK]
MKQLELAVRADMEVMARAHGLTALQYTALTVLQRHPGMSGAQLARRSFVSAQAGSEMIAHLVRKGLISREPHPENRRVLCIGLTEEGRRIVEACEGETSELEGRMLEGVASADVRSLEGLLRTCVRNLGVL